MDIKNASEEISSYKSGAVSIDLQNKELDNFKKNNKEYKPNLEKIDALFVEAKNPIDFIEFLEKIAFDSGVISDINLVPTPKNASTAGVSTAFFQIYAKGGFLNILKFSERLETGPYLAKVSNVTIKKLEEKTEKGENVYMGADANFLIEVVAK